LKRKDLVVGIDVGTSNVRVIVGEPLPDNTVNIVGVGLSSSEGLKKGVIVDLDKTIQSITKAVEEAERMVGFNIKEAYLGLVGINVELISNKGVVAVTSEDREITEEDVERVMQSTRVIPMPSDREIVNVIPRQFIVDGYDGIRDPVGMLGVRLEVDALVVTTTITTLKNLIRCINRAGIEVSGLVLQSLANSEVALSRDEKELGVFLLDLGGGKAELTYFQNGALQNISVLPLGGNHITNDIAVGLRTGFETAESIKLEHGCAFAAMSEDTKSLEITSVGGDSRHVVSERELCNFIEPRVQEIMQMIREEMEKMGVEEMPPAGVVLTGGVSLMDGVSEMAEKMFGTSVRVAEPHFVGVKSPIYTTAVGLLNYVIRYGREGVPEKREEKKGNPIKSWWERIKNWFSEIFE